ncbi:hypothetical protein DFP93_10531 [Aneurinibacillus soli]|uniref:Uncharacterized protein n=1 Tax=Aneurinibacillus soli TaxID=1500254 RepID=A0A0U5BDC2_9BACL|nr:DUF5132 domain-containing protein [Aneurinibacillus soli]PYE62079.1 hypothetical protein DFP93_10531 [Aneurinibacillus soli]BAU28733.1 hypothetical protein CB4_02908 [Aneurinibacillus soli]
MRINLERVVIGSAMLLAAPVLLPIVKTTVSAAGNIGARAAAATWTGLCTTARIAKEEAEDIVAEAQFERLRKRVDREIYE